MKKILTLVIIHKDNQVLLGLKKRGFGMGKYNGFGGKVEKGETIEQAAKREVFEEAGVSVEYIEKMGVLEFSWLGKEQEILEVNIFKATNFSGQPQETEEMNPQWFSAEGGSAFGGGLPSIPFETMWADDKYWFPLLLENKKFMGKFVFDEKNTIVEHQLHESSHSI